MAEKKKEDRAKRTYGAIKKAFGGKDEPEDKADPVEKGGFGSMIAEGLKKLKKKGPPKKGAE